MIAASAELCRLPICLPPFVKIADKICRPKQNPESYRLPQRQIHGTRASSCSAALGCLDSLHAHAKEIACSPRRWPRCRSCGDEAEAAGRKTVVVLAAVSLCACDRVRDCVLVCDCLSLRILHCVYKIMIILRVCCRS